MSPAAGTGPEFAGVVPARATEVVEAVGMAVEMQHPDRTPSQPDRKAANRRLGLILFSIALVFFLGFFAKMVLLG